VTRQDTTETVLRHLPRSTLEAILDRPGVSNRIRSAAAREWQRREEADALTSAVATFQLDWEGVRR